MQPLHVIRVPVPNRDHSPLSVTQVPQVVSRMKSVPFIRKWGEKNAYSFYECGVGGCRGAGLESFTNACAEVPEYIIDAMKRHVEMCEGLVRSSVPQ